MKKILCLFSAISLVLASCSCSDYDNPIIENVENVEDTEDTVLILPQTEKYTSESEPEKNRTATYTYDGNKIVSLDYDRGNKTTFIYTGNVITKAEYYNNGVLKSTTTFTYENNKLKSYLKTGTSEYSDSIRKSYTYNTDGTISTVTVSINPTTQKETILISTVLTPDTKGNYIQVAFKDKVNSVEYDTKNNPFKNILGYTLLLESGIFHEDAITTNNNLTKTVEMEKGVTTRITTFMNTYNDNDFLIKQESSDKTFEYTY
ncbi:hypothetical protein IUY40_17815 [Flavobacterium sp. ALJ2]|uniref:hypothetical protein n=1 Tax=Flavobacterium sp. ALJ2 TaxID=2786960 RepID=UPI00189F34F6|nr:hypothetical protein [Flavobacterium sp. ALJ2]MBF7093395.1 hypothetical protein [Flavobacterium sp. ALJ2]